MSSGYLRVPERKPYEIKDIITRVDEELAELIRGMNILIALLRSLNAKIAAFNLTNLLPLIITRPERAREIIEKIERAETVKEMIEIVREIARETREIERDILRERMVIIRREIEFPRYFVFSVPYPLEKRAGAVYKVSATEPTYHEFKDYYNRIIILSIFDDNVFIDVDNVSREESLLLPANSVFTIYISPEYKKLAMLAENSVARVYVTEWSYWIGYLYV